MTNLIQQTIPKQTTVHIDLPSYSLLSKYCNIGTDASLMILDPLVILPLANPGTVT